MLAENIFFWQSLRNMQPQPVVLYCLHVVYMQDLIPSDSMQETRIQFGVVMGGGGARLESLPCAANFSAGHFKF